MRKISAKIILLMLVFGIGWSGTANATYAISVDKIGTGQGTVSSTNDGDTRSKNIDCGTTCAGTFPQTYDYLYTNSSTNTLRDVNVSLTAIPSVGSVFKGWFLNDGVSPWPNCGTRISCSVTATPTDQQITAKFERGITPTTPVNFTVINEGSGSDYGSVVSAIASPGITCNGVKFGAGNTDCSESFVPGTSVTLNAMVNSSAGAFFAGWEVYYLQAGSYTLQTDMCLNLEPSCNVTVPFNVDDIRVRAKFDLGYILTLQRQGEGAGSLLSASDNLQTTCLDSLCTQTYNANRKVTITAVATANSKVAGWTVDGIKDSSCADTALTCTVTMSRAHLVAVKFDKVLSGSFTATLLKEGSGTGFGSVKGTVVASASEVITCGTKCSGSVNQSDSVRFEATPDKVGVSFAGWKVRFWDPVDLKWVSYPDMCTGLQPVCEVTVTQNVQVMARFDYDIILTVVRDGNGAGSISSSSQALNKCTVDSTKTICDQTFVGGQSVTLTAIAELKSRFVKWSGCATTTDGNQDGSQEICTVTMDKAKLVTATFEIIDSAKLSVTKDPNSTGTGTVKSDLLGLDCGSICNRNYAFGTEVVLTATAFEGSEFVGWGGDWCSGLQLTCKVTMSQAKDVTVRFDKGFKLTLNKQGAGEGSVFSNPAGINCGTACAYNFTNTATVVLTAKPVNGSTFLGWGGACSGTQLTCTVAMTQAQTVTVTFSGVSLGKAVDNTDLTWTSSGDAPWYGQLQKDAKVNTVYFGGSAAISGGISHDQESSVETVVTGPGELSFYWKVSSEVDRDVFRFEKDGVEAGKISGEADWTLVKVSLPEGAHVLKWTYAKDADLSRGVDSAWFERVHLDTVNFPAQLTLINQGSGVGSVSSNPSGISCGGACTADFNNNTAVMLTVNVAGGSAFAGWGGACSDVKPTCLVTMNGSKTVTATFNQVGSGVNNAVLNLGLLNDTGIDWCANKTTNYLVDKDAKCEALAATFPGQDGLMGRDAIARKAKLFKMGSGDAGFDYTKVCNNGQAAGDVDCPAQPVLGEKANQWGCTRDNVTGLIWEVKTSGGLRDKEGVYSWYDSNARTNGGSKGNNCATAVCNTSAYVQAVNQQGLCGANDWRLPTRHELHSIAHQGRSNPSVDIAFFPNTVANNYWTATSVAALPLNAWTVSFESGWDFWDNKNNKQRLRLVRQCPSCELATTVVRPSYHDNRLYLPLVSVGNDFYDANLSLVSANPMVFELAEARLKTMPLPRSGRSDQVYSNGLLVLANVTVGADHYKATLQLMPGSNPLRFRLQTAQLLH